MLMDSSLTPYGILTESSRHPCSIHVEPFQISDGVSTEFAGSTYGNIPQSLHASLQNSHGIARDSFRITLYKDTRMLCLTNLVVRTEAPTARRPVMPRLGGHDFAHGPTNLESPTEWSFIWEVSLPIFSPHRGGLLGLPCI